MTLANPSTDIDSPEARANLIDWVVTYQLTEVEEAFLPSAMAIAAVAGGVSQFKLLEYMMVDENTANMILSLCEELEVIREHIKSGVIR